MPKDTKSKIARAATAILAKEGYRALTMRRVASACGISPGNLTYHFPSVDDLMLAAMNLGLEEYEQQITSFLQRRPADQDKTLTDLVTFFIRDALSPRTSAVMIEFWALAQRDPNKAAFLDQTYKKASDMIANVLLGIEPDIDHATANQVASTLLVFSEGGTALFSRKPLLAFDEKSLIETAVRTLRQMISDAVSKGS
jgi:AcrR family transcriptional regulator